MARVKTARTTRARHKKILKQAKGYYGAKSYRFRNANQAVMKSLAYAYVGRKDRKSNFVSLEPRLSGRHIFYIGYKRLDFGRVGGDCRLFT